MLCASLERGDGLVGPDTGLKTYKLTMKEIKGGYCSVTKGCIH